MESLGYWRHSNIVKVQQWIFGVQKFKHRFQVTRRVWDHKYVGIVSSVKMDSWEPEVRFQQTIIGPIVACECCHEITFHPSDLLRLVHLITYLCSAPGFQTAADSETFSFSLKAEFPIQPRSFSFIVGENVKSTDQWHLNQKQVDRGCRTLCSSFSDRLLHTMCTKKHFRRSFFSVDVKLHNHKCSQ